MKERKQRPPGFIIKAESVDWKIKSLFANECPSLDYDFCNKEHVKCCYENCPIKTKKPLIVNLDPH